MQGVRPRIEPVLLPDQYAVVARDCHFDSGVISPLYGDTPLGVTFPTTPQTIFHYQNNDWFAWAADVDVIRSPVAQDAYGRVYYTDGSYPKVTQQNMATQGATRPGAYYRLGGPAPKSIISVSAITPPSGATDDSSTDDETRFYTHTYVTATGEEGAPAAASAEVTIAIPDSSVTLNLPAVETNDNNITLRRIYRSATTDSSSGYYKVAELPIAQTTYVDSKDTDELGAELETDDYLPPPATMRGLCLMANGIAAGFDGNTVLFSGAYLPYAWPEANQLTTEDDVVAVAPIGTSLVVGTQGYPYVMTGVSPDSITAQKLTLPQACISKRSMVSLEGIVIYAAPDGLVGISESTATLLTEQIMTRAEWLDMKPSTLRAWGFEGKYIGITDNGSFIYDPKANTFRTISDSWNAAYNDLEADSLFLAKGTNLYSWQSNDGDKLEFVWHSKPFVPAPGTSFSCCRIVSDDIDSIGVRFYTDGSLLFDIPIGTVPDTAFRLPAERANQWSVEVYGSAKVSRITLATSMEELIING